MRRDEFAWFYDKKQPVVCRVTQNKREHKSHFRPKKSKFDMFVALSPQSFFECEPGRFGRIFFFHFHVMSTGHPIIFCHLTLPRLRSQEIQLVEVIQRLTAEVIHPLSVAVIVSLCFSAIDTLFRATGRICTDPGVRFVPFVFNLNSDLRNCLQQSCCAVACHSCH